VAVARIELGSEEPASTVKNAVPWLKVIAGVDAQLEPAAHGGDTPEATKGGVLNLLKE